MTNFERIKNMSVEEMADKLERMSNYVCVYYDCEECPFDIIGSRGCCISGFTDWLESEVEE